MRQKALLLIGIVLFSAVSTVLAADWTEIKQGNPDRKEVCLTVDAGGYIDSPTDYTEKMFRANAMLDALEARNVPVTTFVTKMMVDNYPENIARFIQNGYEFGNHTVSHPHFNAKNTDGSYVYSDDYLLNDQILACETVLRNAYSGRTARPWFRFPYGERDARALSLVRRAGYRSIYWGCGGTDSNSPSVDGTAIKNSILPNLKNGQIILLHWQGYHTYEVIGEIIDATRAQGYEFVTLSQLMAPTPADGAIVDNSDQAVTVTGTWSSVTTGTEKFGGDYITATTPGTGLKTVTWSVDLPSGNYTVAARWSGGTTRATDAPFTVIYSGGMKTVRVNQQVSGGSWNSLGTYYFEGGTPARVVLSDNTTAVGKTVVADAIKFIPSPVPPSAYIPSWTLNIGSPIYSSPTIADGVAYVGADNGNLYAINVTNGTPGQQRWSVPLGSSIRSRPILSNGTLYVTTMTGQLAAINPIDGAVAWQVSVGTGELTSPAPFRDSVFVGSADGHIYRVHQSNGALMATSGSLGGPVKSMPAVRDTDLVWAGGADGKLYCLNSNLNVVRWTLGSGPLPLDAPPFIDWYDNVLIAGGGSETLLMVNSSTGGPMCPVYTGLPPVYSDAVQTCGGISGSAWVDHQYDMAYFGTRRGLIYGLELTTGLPPAQWPLRVQDSGPFSSSPVLVAGPSRSKFIYIGSDTGKFFAIPAGMPGRYRVYQDPNAGVKFASSPAVSGTTVNDRVVVGTTDGRILAFPLL